MKRLFLFLLLAVFAGKNMQAQATDSTCSVIMKVMNNLREKETRIKMRGALLETQQGSLSKNYVYKSNVSIPGMTDAVLTEGLTRTFKAYINAPNYEAAVKELQHFNEHMHQCFDSGWTFTENNEPRELAKSYKVTKDKDVLSGAVKYYVERNGSAFRVVLELPY